MDDIVVRFRAMKWNYADKDPVSRALLARRIAEAGRRSGLLTYSDLVREVTFHLPNLREVERLIDPSDWEDLDRAIVGDFLGFLSMESYERAGFFSSALVVSKTDGSPGEGFFALLKELGLIASSKSTKAVMLWSDHVAKAHEWCRVHPDAAF